jgi:hypothetical protein
MDSNTLLVLKIKKRHPKHYCKLLQNKYLKIWNEIEKYNKDFFVRIELTNPQKIFNWVYQIHEIPKCPIKNVPLKFYDLKFEYRKFSERGLASKELIEQRAKNRTYYPNAEERLKGISEKEFIFEENFKEIAKEQIQELFKKVNNIGAVCASLKTKKNAKLYFFVKKNYPFTKTLPESLHCLIHSKNEIPKCPLSGLSLPFVNFEKGYRSTHPKAAKILKKNNKQKALENAPILNLEETKIQLRNLLNELEEKKIALKNLKQSAFKKNASLVKSVEEHTKEYKTLTNKWSEKAYLLLQSEPKTLENVRFFSFEVGYYDTFVNTNSSLGEEDLANWIQTLNLGEVKRSQRILNGMEIDILLPKLCVGIEYHGEYYHNWELRGSNHHKQKADLALSSGIQLIQVFESEWYNKKEIVQSILKSKLGVVERKIYGRQCEVKLLDTKTKDGFLTKNHIQGSDKSKIALGLFYQQELVACMTFGRGYNSQKEGVELVRFCNSLNTTVVGGASKLLKHYVREYNPTKIYTYADRRFANNSRFYETLGFSRIGQTVPNYFYFKSSLPLYTKLQHRFNFAKHLLPRKLKTFDANKTEYQNMKDNGYLKIYDAGSYRYELILN